jgi:catalase
VAATAGLAEPPLSLEGAADHWNHRVDDDYYTQPRLLFRLMSAPQKQALFDNTARAMGDAPRDVKVRHIGHCMMADAAYGEGVAQALGIAVRDIVKDTTALVAT